MPGFEAVSIAVDAACCVNDCLRAVVVVRCAAKRASSIMVDAIRRGFVDSSIPQLLAANRSVVRAAPAEVARSRNLA